MFEYARQNGREFQMSGSRKVVFPALMRCSAQVSPTLVLWYMVSPAPKP